MTVNYVGSGLTILHKCESTYSAEAWKWYAEIKEFSFIFRMGGEPWFSYNFHLWTIPVELKGSMVIYASLVAFAQAGRGARLWCEIGLFVYFLYVVDGYAYALFVAGMFLSDIDLLAEIQPQQLPSILKACQPYKRYIFPISLVIGLWLGGVPATTNDMDMLRESPGWYYLSFLKPQAVFMFKAFYLTWAGIAIVASIPHIAVLRSFFEISFNQFLGRVSYAFYLLHGPVLWIVGDRVYAAVGWPQDHHAENIPNWIDIAKLPSIGPFGLELNFIVAQMVLLPLTLWLASIGTDIFDRSSIRISSWMYNKILDTELRSKGLLGQEFGSSMYPKKHTMYNSAERSAS